VDHLCELLYGGHMTDRTEPTQPYRRVLDDLLKQINSGRKRVGDRLPSTRELAEKHGVAQMTVRNALRELQDRKMAAPTHGVGWFVTQPPKPEPDLQERVSVLESQVSELRARLNHESTVPE